nr:hypothetical protein L204_04159 [Cryptococcus depauperatus CBS 7855]
MGSNGNNLPGHHKLYSDHFFVFTTQLFSFSLPLVIRHHTYLATFPGQHLNIQTRLAGIRLKVNFNRKLDTVCSAAALFVLKHKGEDLVRNELFLKPSDAFPCPVWPAAQEENTVLASKHNQAHVTRLVSDLCSADISSATAPSGIRLVSDI